MSHQRRFSSSTMQHWPSILKPFVAVECVSRGFLMCSRVLNKHIEREAAGSNHLQHTNICNIHRIRKVCMEGKEKFLSKKSFMFQGFIYFGKLNVNVSVLSCFWNEIQILYAMPTLGMCFLKWGCASQNWSDVGRMS